MDAGSTSVNGLPGSPAQYRKRDFWSQENQKYATRHYRLEKSAKLISKVAAGRSSALLDLGCGPAALRDALPGNIRYHGIDIAIQEPAPYLMERDFVEEPISFAGRHFDIVLAQGVFEYMGGCEAQKLSEIASLLNDGGTFIVSYVNFSHRNARIYPIYNNIQRPDQFHESLSRYFEVSKVIPVSHNWPHSDPHRYLIKKANMYFNFTIPFVSNKLAVEHYYVCSPVQPHGAR